MKAAIIPARGGSKRIPKKNIKNFCGKPIIAWSIEAALRSKCFDIIIVSTDDEQISDVAIQYNAKVPFIRPPEISDDYTGTSKVIKHAITWLHKNGYTPSEVCCIYPTAPLISHLDIQAGLKMLNETGAMYAFTACEYPFPIQRALRITDTGKIEMINTNNFHIRSQDFETYFHDAGQFYWGRTEAWIEEIPVFTSDAVPVLVPKYRVQDIDGLDDWKKAELLFKAHQESLE